MEIIKYTCGGQLSDHDIHYTHDGKFLRYASDKEPKERLVRLFSELQRYAAEEIAGFEYLSIKRIEWYRKNGNTEVKITGATGSQIHGRVKVELPRFGYGTAAHQDEITGEWRSSVGPLECDMTGVELIQKLEDALAEYVRDGSSQLQFDFTDAEKVIQLQN